MVRKTPKPPKGGATRNQPPQGAATPNQGNKVTADMLIADRHLYEDRMWKSGQVKNPEGMEVNEKFLEQLDIIKSFASLKIDSPVLDKFATVYGGHESYEECMQISGNNNVMILLEALSYTIEYSDKDDPYDMGWVNILKTIVSLYCGNPYTRDRIGYLMWSIAKHMAPNCYFPLELDLYYDPRLWHRPGQFPREPLPLPRTLIIGGGNQDYGPEDDIWDCELSDT